MASRRAAGPPGLGGEAEAVRQVLTFLGIERDRPERNSP